MDFRFISAFDAANIELSRDMSMAGLSSLIENAVAPFGGRLLVELVKDEVATI